jgi:hypothetical protein
VSQAGAAARRHDPTVLTLRQEDLDEGAEVIGRVIAESHEKEHCFSHVCQLCATTNTMS